MSNDFETEEVTKKMPAVGLGWGNVQRDLILGLAPQLNSPLQTGPSQAVSPQLFDSPISLHPQAPSARSALQRLGAIVPTSIGGVVAPRACPWREWVEGAPNTPTQHGPSHTPHSLLTTATTAPPRVLHTTHPPRHAFALSITTCGCTRCQGVGVRGLWVLLLAWLLAPSWFPLFFECFVVAAHGL